MKRIEIFVLTCLIFTSNYVQARAMTQEEHKACRDGVAAVAFFKYRSILGDESRRRISNLEAQGKVTPGQYNALLSVEKADCQQVFASTKFIYETFEKKYSACLRAGTHEQLAAIYELDPNSDMVGKINSQIYFDTVNECPVAKSQYNFILNKLQDAKTDMQLCELSAEGLHELGVIFQGQCKK